MSDQPKTLIQYARENHMVIVEDPEAEEGCRLEKVDVSLVQQDQSWLSTIVELLAGIGVTIDLESLRGYKQFVFFRLKDPTGVSSQLIGAGPRIVVAGVELPNGYLAFIWFGSKVPSLTIHTSVENAMLAHGHGMDTQFVYV